MFAPQDRRWDGQVLIPGVHAGTEADLVGRRSGELVDRDDVVGAVRLGDQRDQRGQVDLGLLVVAGAGVRPKLDELVLALLTTQEASGLLVGREDRRGPAQ